MVFKRIFIAVLACSLALPAHTGTTTVTNYTPVSKDDLSLVAFDKHPLAVSYLKKTQVSPSLAFSNVSEILGEQLNQWISTQPLKEDLCHTAAFGIVCGDVCTSNDALPLDTWKHLGLFDQNNTSLKLARTKTYLGQAALAQLLINPCTSAAEITQRREALRSLVDNTQLRRTLSEALKNIHNQESIMFRWWYHARQTRPTVGNTNPTAAGMTTRFWHIASIIPPTLGFLGAQHFINQPWWINGQRNHQAELGFQLSTYLCILGFIFGPLNAGLHLHTLKTIQSTLISYARVLDEARTIARVIERTPQLKEIPGAVSILQHCNEQSGNLGELNKLLQNNTFATSASYFSSVGNIQAARNLLYATLPDMYKLLRAIAHVDAFVSMATLVRDQEYSANKYCFVDFVEGETPTLELINAWSPANTLQNSPVQSISLTGNKHNLLLTGPYRSGKSSSLRNFCHAILLAQAFGIAPAEKCRMTPFGYIHFVPQELKKDDLMNPNQQLSQQQHVLFERLDTLPANTHALVILDTTQELWPDQALTHHAGFLNRYPQALTMIATHNDQLALENFSRYAMRPAQEGDGLPPWVFTLKSK